MVTIDQLDYCTLNIHNHGANNAPFVEYSKSFYESVGVGVLKDSSLMGNFPSTPHNPPQQIYTIHMISITTPKSFELYDPWVVPNQSKIDLLDDTMPLNHDESIYDAIQASYYISTCNDKHLVALDPYSLLSWLGYSPYSFDYLL